MPFFQYLYPHYGMTGNGSDTWYVSIFWGNALHDKNNVQHVSIFKAEPTTQHSTVIRTESFKQLAYLQAKDRAHKELKRLRTSEPVRPTNKATKGKRK